MRKFPKMGGASRRHARSPRHHLPFTKEGPAPPMLTFFDNAHGENGRAQAAHSGTPERNRNGYDARPKTHDRSQPPAPPLASAAPPAPWWVPRPSVCMLAHANTNTTRFPGVQAPGVKAACADPLPRGPIPPHSPQSLLPAPAPAPAPPPGRTCPHKQEWCRQYGGCFRR